MTREEMERHIPPMTLATLNRYIERGVPTGGFLEAVLSNDLMGAFNRADIQNRAALYEIVSWLFNYAPAACWGSRGAYVDWLYSFQKREDAEE